jgi:hypothetical protein
MLTEDRVKILILEALKTIKESEATYRNLVLNDQTTILGINSPFDSIAFTAFATDLEEKLEDETGVEYALRVDEIFRLHGKKSAIRVQEMAKLISQHMTQTSRKR